MVDRPPSDAVRSTARDGHRKTIESAAGARVGSLARRIALGGLRLPAAGAMRPVILRRITAQVEPASTLEAIATYYGGIRQKFTRSTADAEACSGALKSALLDQPQLQQVAD